MNLNLVTLGDALGSVHHCGSCWDCGTWLSRNDRVLPIGRGDYVCNQCAFYRSRKLDKEFVEHQKALNHLKGQS